MVVESSEVASGWPRGGGTTNMSKIKIHEREIVVPIKQWNQSIFEKRKIKLLTGGIREDRNNVRQDDSNVEMECLSTGVSKGNQNYSDSTQSASVATMTADGWTRLMTWIDP